MASHRAANSDQELGALNDERTRPHVVRAILGDLHFWIPAIALIVGVALLIYLH